MRSIFSKIAFTAALMLAITFTFSCSVDENGGEQKCGGVVYDADTYRCEAGELIGKCKGVDYYPAYQQCVGGVVIDGSQSSSSRGSSSSVKSGGSSSSVTSGGSSSTVVTPTYSLDGVWERDDGTIISIYDGKAVFSNILTSSAWKEVENRGNIKIGDSYWKNITKTGDLTWNYENLTYNTSTYALSNWMSGTITMNSNGQSLITNLPGTIDPVHTFTKRSVSTIDGIWERDDGTIISIYDGKAVFSNILTSSAWKEVENRGNIKIGDSYWKNITKTGDLTWNYENLTYNTSTYALSNWMSGTITMNSNGQSLITNLPGTIDPVHTFTKK